MQRFCPHVAEGGEGGQEVEDFGFAVSGEDERTVVVVTRKNQESLGCDEQLFRRIVKQAFNQRRKMLRNTLKGFFPEEVLKEAYFQQRPEVLSVEDFIQLTRRAEETIEPS